ncbi:MULTISPECIES: glutamate-1-semialdehyde 2,1-aminomutase [Methanobacterium]|jgi:glutamate-1-semialdehyde 2,1-aminomutase|uniref:Glutamate-1-semialdehyde 2,1-aminomutase n=1 Tax=Methanobacterium veterum TaxID=408577 RepID=A0A9E5A353_9EURY|nr:MULTISPECIES: glutamate-1-semialdehyde 2,1-aminomutase [Methanobacterium]MCZ3367120.1 glutamate-1-semialdehyde 2,1-aminomutase [Methanobacterium veterum]MCZ3373732.1 glutamate-1-semialdehyde 2,1-aminomutase [Methanobacterium veterum]
MKSEELFKEAKNYLPGGVDSPVRAYKPYPFFAKEAKGSKIIDVDGNSYIDYCLAYGPLVLGHANEKIMGKVVEQLKIGSAYGVPTENEIELAKLVIKKVPCAEMVRFVNSGTEATMSAIRLARAATSKKKIIKFEGSYHGAHDYVLVKSGSGAAGLPDSPGVPEDTTKNTVLIPFNNKEAVVDLIEREGDDIAAIIVEPIMGNVGFIPPKEDYLKFLREITGQNNIILIFDEVITGFRIAEGGAQEYFGVTPDLVTFGKILGGGFPIGALAGKKEFMEMIAPAGTVYQAGTFNGNPVSITAGLAMLNQLNDNFYAESERKGKLIRTGIQDILSDNNLDFKIAGLSSMFQLYFTDKEVYDYASAKSADTEKFNHYFQTLLKNGVFIPPSQFECCFISSMHDKEDIQKTLEAVEKAIKV